MKKYYPFIFLFFLHSSLSAQTFVNINASGNNDGSTWTDAYTDLQSALDAATEGSDLWIAAGTYKPAANILADSNWFLS